MIVASSLLPVVEKEEEEEEDDDDDSPADKTGKNVTRHCSVLVLVIQEDNPIVQACTSTVVR